MLLEIPNLLNQDELSHFRRRLEAAPWVDGTVTSGYQAAQAKHNEQVDEKSDAAREMGEVVLAALTRSQLFFTAALPRQVFPPLFNRYREGMTFGNHIDSAIRTHVPTRTRLRTDLSATLFLSAPQDYQGGELLVEDTYGVKRVKLEAGSMVLYPSSSLHRVEPITRGTRTACVFWVQSMVREDARRATLFDLDMAIVRLTRDHPGDPALLSLTGVYHNLLRMWAEP